MLMKTGILYFTTGFHGFGILRHMDPFVRMLHIYDSLLILFTIFLFTIFFQSDFFILLSSISFKSNFNEYAFASISLYKHLGCLYFFFCVSICFVFRLSLDLIISLSTQHHLPINNHALQRQYPCLERNSPVWC